MQYDVVSLGSRVLQTSTDVLSFQIGEVLKDLRFAGARAEHFQHVLDSDPHSPDTGTTCALLRVESDAVEVVHRARLRLFGTPLKFSLRRLGDRIWWTCVISSQVLVSGLNPTLPSF